jgi:hypothetical protein
MKLKNKMKRLDARRKEFHAGSQSREGKVQKPLG